MGHHDHGIDCETFCGGTPDDEPAAFAACIHSTAGLCPKCQEEYDADPGAWSEYGDHPEGIKRWQALQDEIEQDRRRMEAAQDGTPPDAWDNLPF